MPDRRKSPKGNPTRSLEDLLAASKRLVKRATEASQELNKVGRELEATQREIKKRMKEQGLTVN